MNWPTNEVIKVVLMLLIFICVLAIAIHSNAFRF
jgi:hypothetical protein